MSRLPFVSIVVPAYNEAQVLPDCIEALLEQSYPRSQYEVIVVDNGSTDGTRAVIDRYPVRSVTENETQSSYAARNAGLRKARGDIIAFTDADCVPHSEWVSTAVEGFKNSQVGAVAGGIVSGEPGNNVEAELKRRDWLTETGTLNHPFLPYPQTANAFYRRSVFEAIGEFEETWISGGDADLAWRMQLLTPMTLEHVPEATVKHRHRTDLSSVFQQSMKWGHGSARLERKYGRQSVPSDLRSGWRTGMYLARTVGGYLRRTLFSALKGTPFNRTWTYLVNLASRGGRQLGLIYGRFRQRGKHVADW